MVVRLGDYNLNSTAETRFREFAVSNLFIHEEFNAATYDNDIAVLRLDKPTHFNSYIWPICLPTTARSYVNEQVVVAGWGQQYYAGPTSNVLLEVSIPVWDQEKCKEAYTQRITDNNLCAAALEGGKDSCLVGGCIMLPRIIDNCLRSSALCTRGVHRRIIDL